MGPTLPFSEVILLPEAGKVERKSVLTSTRLPESLALALKKEAADGGTTVNAVINSILRRHFEWDKPVRESGFALIQKPVLKELIERADDETLVRIGREIVPAWFEDMSNYWFQDSSFDRILDTLNTRFKFDPLMHVEMTRKGGAYSVVFRHDLGPKWSVLAEAVARALAKKFFASELQVTRGDSVVMARFKFNPATRVRTSH
jgi:hypothetical protein